MSIYHCPGCGNYYSGKTCLCGTKNSEYSLSPTIPDYNLFEKLFEEKLKALCQSYDYKHGSYPESYYEGKAIYEFCLESQNEQNGQKNKSSINFDEPYDVFVENWEKL